MGSGGADDETILEARLAGLEPAAVNGSGHPEETLRHDTSAGSADRSVADSELPRISLRKGAEPGPAGGSDFMLVSMLGEGGMGCVHLAWQRSLARDVAVKTLKSEASADVGIALLREARLTGSLEHPGVVPIHALGADEHARPLLVMKRVEGVEFAKLLADPAHPMWAERTGASTDRLAATLEIIIQVCRTVEFAHARGVIHRDIKPANVMVGRYGEVYLLDWGVAQKQDEAQGEGLVGTPVFMAPEMFLGRPVDERTDVYLLGAMLHNALTGTRRHVGADLLAIGKAAIRSEPIAYDGKVPAMLAEICNHATARDADDRPQSVQELRQLVTAFLQHRSAVALSATARERLSSLHVLMGSSGPGRPPGDLAAAYRLATEARFGFAQCLKEHPSHADAIAGAREAVVALVDLELRQGHADSADAILRELDAPDHRLAARIADLRRQDDVRRRETSRLQALDRDRDPNIGFGSRAVVFGFAVVMSIGIGWIVGWQAPAQADWTMVEITCAAIALTGSLSFVVRKRLFSTAYNRKVASLFYLFMGFWLVDRVTCAVTHEAASSVLAAGLWIAATSLAAGAITVERRLWVCAVPLVAGALVIRVLPEQPTAVFSVAMSLAAGLTAAQLLRRPAAK